MAKILVTGGAGFIGSHLCDQLVGQEHEVIVVDDFSSGSRENLESVSDKVRVFECSIDNIASLADELAGVTRIYHLAALISGYDSLNDPDAYAQTNIMGLSRVLELAKSLERPRILFASSSTVYGNQSEPEMSERTAPNPQSMYALTKLTGEHMLAMYSELYDFSYVCLRLFNVYGSRQSPDHPYANVTCKFSHAAAHGNGVKLYGDGEQSRDFVHVSDVVAAFLAVSEECRDTIYNVGTGKDASISELLGYVQKLAESPLPVEQCPPWPNDIRAIRANVDRLASETGFTPKVELLDGLAETVQFFRNKA